MATYYRSGSQWVSTEAATFDASFLGNGATIYLSGESSNPSTVNNLSGTLNANPPSTSDNFNSNSGWVGGNIYQHQIWYQTWNGYGYDNNWYYGYYNTFLGPYSGGGGAQNTYKDFNFDGLPVTISFDLHRFGSWDSETFTAYVNNTPVFQTSSGPSGWLGGAGSTYYGNTSGYNWSLVSQDSFANRLFSEYGDQTARVTVSLPSSFFASNSNLRLGFGSTLDENTDNESYGIDNLTITTLPVFTSPLTINTTDSNGNSINVITGTNSTTINASGSGDVVTVNAEAMVDNTTLDLNGSNTFNVNNIGANTDASAATGAVNLSYGWASDGSANITTGTGATSINGSSATLVVNAALQAENASITLSGGASQVVNNLVADINAVSLSGSLTVNAADASDGGITINTGTNNTTISASGSGDVITVNANAMVDNTWLDLNGSATFNASNLDANTDASGSSGIVTLAYVDIPDNGASITLGSGATTVSGSTTGDTLTINAASQLENASIVLTGNANQVVNNLVADINATSLSGALTVNTGNASDNGITITTGTGNTTVSASGSNDIVTVEADLMLDNTTLDLNGSATINANKIEAHTDASGSSGSVNLSYADVTDNTATITTGTGPISVTSSTSGDTFTVNATSLKENITLTQSGAAAQVVTNLVGNVDATALTGTLTVTTGNAGDNGISISTGTGTTSVSGGGSDDTITINAASQPESASLSLSGVANQVVNNLVANVSATSLSGSLTVNAADAPDGGITITTGSGNTTVTASGSGDTITVNGNAMIGNNWLELNGSATFSGINLDANTDASGTTGIVTLTYSDIPDNDASITLGSGATTVTGSTTGDTLTINAASQLENASIVLTGNANQVVNNLVADINATSLSGALTVNTGNAGDNGITITTGTGNTTVTASGSNDIVTVEADLMLDNTTLDLNGSATINANKIEAHTDASGSSGSVNLSYADVTDNTATITTGTGPISVTSSTSGDTLTVNATSLKENISLTQSGAAAQVVTNLVGNVDATALTGTLTVTTGNAGDNGISISTGNNDTTITASGSSDVITVDADTLADNKTLDLNGSATFNVSKLEANTDAAGSSGSVNLAYTAITDKAATITTGTGATSVSGTTADNTLTINAASLAQNTTLTQSGAAAQTVTNLVGDINAASLTNTLTVTTGDAADNNINITTGSKDTTITASGSSDRIWVNANALEETANFKLNGSAGFRVTNLDADVDASGSSGTVKMVYVDVPDSTATIKTGSGATSVYTTASGDSFTVDATSLANNAVLNLSGPSSVTVNGLKGDLNGNHITYSSSFDSASDWTGGLVNGSTSYGNFLGAYANGPKTSGQDTFRTFNVDDALPTKISFDVLRFDTWGFPDEFFNVYLNDSPVMQTRFWHDVPITSTSGTTNGFSWTMTVTDPTFDDRGMGQWKDHSAKVTIDIPAGYQSFKLGFGSTLDENVMNESYGIDNLSVFYANPLNGPLTVNTVDNTTDNTISITTGTAATTVNASGSGDSVTVDAGILAQNTSLDLNGSASFAVTNLVGDVTATDLTGTLSVTTGNAGDNGISIATGNNDTTITANGSSDVITVDADTLADNKTLDLNGSATFNVSKLEANTDASGTSGSVTLAYTAVTDQKADISTGSAAITVSGSTVGDTLTINAASLAQNTTLTQSGAADQIVTNLVGDINATALNGTLTVTTGNASDNNISIVTGSKDTTITASGSGDVIAVNADTMADNSKLDLNGSAIFNVTNLEANTDAAGSSGSVRLTYSNVTDNDAKVTTGSGVTILNTTASDDKFTVDATSLANNTGLLLTGPSSISVSGLTGDLDANAKVAVSDSFDSASGWSGGWITAGGGYYGNFLGRYSADDDAFKNSNQGQNTFKSFTLNSMPVTISFQVNRLDSWDGEAFTAYINDTPAFQANFGQYAIGSQPNGSTNGFSWSLTPIDSYTNRGFASYSDQSATVTINVPAGYDVIKLGFGSGLDQDVSDESYGIDNLSISGSLGTATGPLTIATGNNTIDNNISINLGTGNTTLTGGDSSDTINVTAMNTNNQVFSARTSTANVNVIAGANSQTITVSATGNDTVDGGAGIDTLSYAGGTTDPAVDVTITSYTTLSGTSTGQGNDQFTNIETLVGGNGIDILRGINSTAQQILTITGDTSGTLTNSAGTGFTFNDFESFFLGSGGSDILIDNTGDSTVSISGANSGTIDQLAFGAIENLNLSTGVDEVSVSSGGSLSGTLDLGEGATNKVDMASGAGAIGAINSGAGDDTFTINGGSVTGAVTAGNGINTLTITDTSSSIGSYSGGTGVDTITSKGGDVNGAISTGSAADSVTLSEGAKVSGAVTLGANNDSSDGNDVLSLDASSIAGAVNTGSGADTVSVLNASTISNNVTLGTNTDSFDAADTLIVTGASSSSKSVITGSITTGAGADVVTLTDATIGSTGATLSLGSDSNSLDGNDTLIGAGAEITATISTGAGSDVIQLSKSSAVTGSVVLGTSTDTVGGNNDYLSLDASSIKGNVDMGAGVDTVSIDNASSITGYLDTGTGVDSVAVDNASQITGNVSLGAGDDTLSVNNASTITGNVNADTGLDVLNLLGASTISGNVTLGDNSHASTDVDKLTVTGTSSNKAVITGNITTGSAADEVRLTDAKIGGTGATLSLGSDSNSLDGNDTLIGAGAEITATITTGAGSDVIQLSKSSAVTGSVVLGTSTDTVGGNNDYLSLDASSIKGNVDMGAGVDTVSIDNASSITGYLDTGTGVDTVAVDNASQITGNVSLGAGDDTLSVNNASTITGSVNADTGLDVLNVLGASTISGNVTLGDNSHASTDVDKLTVTGTSSNKAVITGNITTGSAADEVRLTDAKIGGTGATLSLGSDSNSLDGNDTLIGEGAEITATITTGAGSDVIQLSKSSAVTGSVVLGTSTDTVGGNNDYLSLDASSIKGNVDMGAGVDTVSIDNASSITGYLDTGTGVDFVAVENASQITGNVSLGAGDDTLSVNNASTITGNVNADTGLDVLNLLGASTISGNVTLGDNSHASTDVDKLTVTGTSSSDAVITGNITTGSGADTVTLTNAKIGSTGATLSLGSDSNSLDGNDTLIGEGVEITATITAGAGSDVIQLSKGSAVTGAVVLGTGTDAVGGNNDLLTLDASSITGNVDMGAGVDTVSMDNGARITGNLDTGTGVDTVSLNNGSQISGNVSLGTGDDTLTLDNASSITGNVNADTGLDVMNVLGASTITGNVVLGDNGHASTDIDTLTVTGTSTNKAVITGNITTGSAADEVRLTDAKIGSPGATLSLGSDSNSLDGNDTLIGEGAEITATITGGAGSDVIQLNKGSAVTGSVVMGAGTDAVGGNNDLLTLDQSSITGNVLMASGLDTVSVLNASSIKGDVTLGENTDAANNVDRLIVTGASSSSKSEVIGNVTMGSGADLVNLSNAVVGTTGATISLGSDSNSLDGNDTLIGDGAEITGTIIGGAGSDVIQLNQKSAVSGDVILGTGTDAVGGNNDLLTLDDSSISGNVSMASGLDTVSVLNGSSIKGDVTLGANTDASNNVDRLIVTGASSSSKSEITGNIYTGSGADLVTFKDASIGSNGAVLSLGTDSNSLDGSDTLLGEGADVTATIITGAGSDVVQFTLSSSVTGNVNLGSDGDIIGGNADILTLDASSIKGNVFTGAGADTLSVLNASIITGNVTLGSDTDSKDLVDTLIVTGTSSTMSVITGSVTTGAGADLVTLTDAKVGSTGETLSVGIVGNNLDGNDTLIGVRSEVIGDITTGAGSDTILLGDSSQVTGDLTLGSNTDLLDNSDYLTLTSKAGIVGDVALGYADDTLNFGEGIKNPATITGDVAFGVGTWDTISYKNNEGPINVSINKHSNGTATESFAKYVTGLVSDFEFIIGSDYSSPTTEDIEGDTIYDNANDSLVVLTGPNSGVISDIDFISIENLQLRSGQDTISFQGPSNAPGLIFGRADGGGIEDADYVMGEYVGGSYVDTGVDLLDYKQYLAGPVTVNLSLNQATGVFADKAGGLISGDGSISTTTEDSSFENVDGSKFSDTITGDNQSEQGNVIRGMAGNDTIDGLAGDDTIDGGDSTAGPDGNDVIAGGDGADLIIASDGSDTISGGSFDTSSGKLVAIDDGFADTLTYLDENEGVDVTLTGVDMGIVKADAASSLTVATFTKTYTDSGDAQLVGKDQSKTTNQISTQWTDTFGDIQRLVLTNRSDVLRIDSNEFLTFSAPLGPEDNTYGVDAAGGNLDTLDYSTFSKDNPVYVNLSSDYYSFDLDANGVIDPTAGEVKFNTVLSATNINASPVATTNGTTKQQITSSDAVDNNGDWGIAMSPRSFGGSYGVNNFEVVIGGAGDDAIVGNDADNIIAGNDGADRLAGGAGNDTIYGGRGDDYIIPGEGLDRVYGGEGINTMVITSTDLAQDKFFVEQGGINIFLLNGAGGANADTSKIDAPEGKWDPAEANIDLLDGGDPTPDPNNPGKFIYDTVNGTASPDTYNFSRIALKNISDVKLGGGDDGVSTAPTSKGVKVTYDGESGDDNIQLTFTFDQLASLNQSGLYVADVQNYVDDPGGKSFGSEQADFTAQNFERAGVGVVSPRVFNDLQGDPEAITQNVSFGLQKTNVNSGGDLSVSATTNTTSTAKADSVYDLVGALVQANLVKGIDQVTVDSGGSLSGVAGADHKASASAITIDHRSNAVMSAYALGMDRSDLTAGTDVTFNLSGAVVADTVGQVGTVVAKVNGTAESAGSRDSSITAGDSLRATITGNTTQSVTASALDGIAIAGAASRTYGIDDANVTDTAADSVQAGTDITLAVNASGSTKVSSSAINPSFVASIKLDDRGTANTDRFVTTLKGSSFPFIPGDRIRFATTANNRSVEAGRDYFVFNPIQSLGEFQLSSTPNGDWVDVLASDDNTVLDVVRPAISTADAISTVIGVDLNRANSGVQSGSTLTLTSAASDDVRATAFSVDGEATAGLNRLGSLDGLNTNLISRVASLSDTSSKVGTAAVLQLSARDGVLVQATSTASDALSEANAQVLAAAASPTTAGSSLTLQAGALLNQAAVATSTDGMADARSGSGAGAGSSTDANGTGVPLRDTYALANAVADSDQTSGTKLSVAAAGNINLAANATTVGGVSQLKSVYSDGNNILSTFDPTATGSNLTPSMIGPHYLAEGQRVQLDSASASALGLPTDNADYVVRLLAMGSVNDAADTVEMPANVSYAVGDAIRFRLNNTAAINVDEKRYGLTLGKTYYVKSVVGTAITLAESPGASAGVINLTKDVVGSEDQLIDADRFQLLKPPASPGGSYTVATLAANQSQLTVLVPSEANAFAGSRQANTTLADPATLNQAGTLAEVNGLVRSSLKSGTDVTLSALGNGVLNAVARNTAGDATAAAGLAAVGVSDSGIQAGTDASVQANATINAVADAVTTGNQSVNDNSLSSVNLSARGIEAVGAADSIQAGSSATITANAGVDTRSTATIVNGNADSLASIEATGVRAADSTFSINIGTVGDLISTARLGATLNPVLVSAVSSGAGNATAQGASQVEGILGAYDTTTTTFSLVQPGASQADVSSQANANLQIQAVATGGAASSTLTDVAGTGAAVVSGIRDMGLNLGAGLSTLSTSALGTYQVDARSVADLANVTATTLSQGLLSDKATDLPVLFSDRGSIAALVNNVTIARAISVAGNSTSDLNSSSLGMGNVSMSSGSRADVIITIQGRSSNQSETVVGST